MNILNIVYEYNIVYDSIYLSLNVSLCVMSLIPPRDEEKKNNYLLRTFFR